MTKILVIEDDGDLSALIELLLQAVGYTVDTAANGVEGLARVGLGRPDLILLDLKMPVMSGVDFAAAYRERYSIHEQAPIIVMTAAAHAAKQSLEIGATDFLSKPFSNDALTRIVAKHAPIAA